MALKAAAVDDNGASHALSPDADADVYLAATDVDDSSRETRQPPSLGPRQLSLPPITLLRPVDNERIPRGLAGFSGGSGDVRFMLARMEQQQAVANGVVTQPEGEPNQQNENLIVVLSRAQMDAVEQYRWAAFFIFLLYIMTFFAWPSYLMSAFGLVTGLVGYGSCRMTQQGSRHNLAWVILFIACNYVMMVFLVWVFVSLFVRDLRHANNDGQPAMVLLAVFVVLGLLLHCRAQRVARDFLSEFRAGVTRMPRPRRGSITIVRPHRWLYVHDGTALPQTTVAQAA